MKMYLVMALALALGACGTEQAAQTAPEQDVTLGVDEDLACPDSARCTRASSALASKILARCPPVTAAADTYWDDPHYAQNQLLSMTTAYRE